MQIENNSNSYFIFTEVKDVHLKSCQESKEMHKKCSKNGCRNFIHRNYRKYYK